MMHTIPVRLLTTVLLPFALIGGATGLLVYDGLAAPPARAAGQSKGVASANPPSEDADDKPPQRPLNVEPRPIAGDKSIKYDYDIVYVRAPRFVKNKEGKDQPALVWPDAHHPTKMRVGGVDLMILHPDGSEEVLVAGGKGAVADPYVSFDGEWVYYAYFHNPAADDRNGGADVYKVHVKSRKIVRLTYPQLTPNTGVAAWSKDFRTPEKGKATVPYTVYNIGPCPLPGGRVAFTSNRDAVQQPHSHQMAFQLFVMDDDGANVDKIGHINVAGALHPVILKDGRIIFSTFESQGMRNGYTFWGVWSIHPDGTNWAPIISAFGSSGGVFHFQTQLSDTNLVIEDYYHSNTLGFGSHFKLPAEVPAGTPPFYSAGAPTDRRMYMGGGRSITGPGPLNAPFRPYGMESLTRFGTGADDASALSDRTNKSSPHVGKVTHPCGAPDNHLLTVWTPGPGPVGGRLDGTDSGIYLIKGGKAIWEPGAMLLIKNDPKYNEQWPRPLVPYKRIYGVDEPARLPTLRNDGTLSRHLPEGTPFGLVGSSSLYKRESFPRGVVAKGEVTAKGDPYAAFGFTFGTSNWGLQGADAGLYENSDIHAIRILAMEPPTTGMAGHFYNRADERLRILGELPVRKFNGNSQPTDPDGNPDTSFLAKIPADVAWTFQTLDKDGMVLNMAQTWHQLRPGEVRTDCGGCHAHSQKPTLFKDTVAARDDYKVFDLTKQTPLLTAKAQDQSRTKWDKGDQTGLRYQEGVKNVEYFRDVQPILQRSCVACHSQKLEKPAGNLVLDPEQDLQRSKSFVERFNSERHAIAMSGLRSVKGRTSFMQNPMYARPFQSRRSMLTWKIYGRRTDGLPEKPLPRREQEHKKVLEAGEYKGRVMPPPEAVAGTYEGPDGQKVKVAPLSDEDRRTLVRWIDLGCPVDFAYDPAEPQKRGSGWMVDDARPTLALTQPAPGVNPAVNHILVGMHDYYTGIDPNSFVVSADFALDGAAAGDNLASRFKQKSPGIWELVLAKPLASGTKGSLTVSVKDRQGNESKIVRRFAVR